MKYLFAVAVVFFFQLPVLAVECKPLHPLFKAALRELALIETIPEQEFCAIDGVEQLAKERQLGFEENRTLRDKGKRNSETLWAEDNWFVIDGRLPVFINTAASHINNMTSGFESSSWFLSLNVFFIAAKLAHLHLHANGGANELAALEKELAIVNKFRASGKLDQPAAAVREMPPEVWQRFVDGRMSSLKGWVESWHSLKPFKYSGRIWR